MLCVSVFFALRPKKPTVKDSNVETVNIDNTETDDTNTGEVAAEIGDFRAGMMTEDIDCYI